MHIDHPVDWKATNNHKGGERPRVSEVNSWMDFGSSKNDPHYKHMEPRDWEKGIRLPLTATDDEMSQSPWRWFATTLCWDWTGSGKSTMSSVWSPRVFGRSMR
ncbi:hypothetical protein CspeluHIS016_0803280 [Cutaneotrichosporon spelunceum]|uniref:Uncharacterized protein n=1 Tax=Cutaneotrichosporon spelunceum TaxID=1672016 RepID=A0AAD3YF89_9TREE|nr:hypothetical protein CspeluHIS016_0803280 [Cutaneotrichosporon spelunceum]